MTCKDCKFLIAHINKSNHYYCYELDFKMDTFPDHCVHKQNKKSVNEVKKSVDGNKGITYPLDSTDLKLLVCGSRSITDLQYVYGCLDEILKIYPTITEIIEGEAPGVDKFAGTYALRHKLILKRMPANWIGYGKIAGFVRNKQMVDLCDIGIAIWDEKSPGTKHTISLLKKQNKLIKIFIK